LPPAVRKPEVEKRQLYIRKVVELARYGYTDGCPGCVAVALGSAPVAHSKECRVRILEQMAKDELHGGKERLVEHAASSTSMAASSSAAPALRRALSANPIQTVCVRRRMRLSDEEMLGMVHLSLGAIRTDFVEVFNPGNFAGGGSGSL